MSVSKVRSLVSVVVMLAVLSGTAGCSTSESPQAIASKAAAANAAVNSLSVDRNMTVNVIISGGNISAEFNISENAGSFVDLSAKQMRTSLDYTGNSSGQAAGNINLALDLYTTNGSVYMNGMNGTAGNVWLKGNLTDTLWASQDRIYQDDFLTTADRITSNGTATIDGIDSYVLSVTPNTGSIAKWLLAQCQAVGFNLTTFNLPASLKNISVTEWIAMDTYLPVEAAVNISIELHPGDVPGLAVNFDKLTINIEDKSRFSGYNQPVVVTLPKEASSAREASSGQLGLTDYMNYIPTPEMQWANPPAMTIDQNKTYTANISTNYGDIMVQLFAKDAPLAVNNFIFLSQQGYYSGVKFHRIVKTFMIQTGDPTGTGAGGPGYSFADELPPKHFYDPGIVAMANFGPNTNGSQFFICTGTDAGGLNNQPNFTQFGQVIGGMDVVQKIAAVPVTSNPGGELSQPAVDVYIVAVTIIEK